MPLDVREKLAAAINGIMVERVIKGRLESLGVEPWGLGPKEMEAHVKKERARWTDVVRKPNVKM